jgi:hypothetical protein
MKRYLLPFLLILFLASSSFASGITMVVGGGINDAPPVTGYEDLSTYTVVDEHGNFTISTTQLTVVNFPYDHSTSYVYYDFGVGYFGVNMEIQFEITVSALTDAYDPFSILALTNALGTGHDVAEGPNVELNDQEEGNAYIELWSGHGDYASGTHLHNIHVLNTKYYCTFISTYGASNTSNVKLGVYTDAARTILAGGADPYGTGSIPEAHGSQTFRYLVLAMSSNAASDANQVSMVIDHVKIISH